MEEGYISFPPSKTCLWDERPTGDIIKLHISAAGWIKVKINSNVIDMAVRHSSKQSCDSEAWLMATLIISTDNHVVLEVNRFDPGKWIRDKGSMKLHPTIVLPGDIPIHSKVIKCRGSSHRHGILTHNMVTLQEAFTSLSQRLSSHKTFGIHSILSLRLVILLSHDRVIIKCGCVLPSAISIVHPVSCPPLLSTALSRNLTGFYSLSSLQGTIHTGYLSMDKSRKLVPILSSDDHAHSLPLVGIWVSGVTIDHPVIWSTALHYINTSAPLDRVFGERCGFLILLPGNKENQLWQCFMKDDGGRKWAWHIGESSMETSCCELIPVIEGTGAYTLLDTSHLQWEKQDIYHDESLPLLLPAPRPVSIPNLISHDTDLSCISELNTSHNNIVSEAKHDLIQEQQKQLVVLQEQVKNLLSDKILVKEATVQTTPTFNVATNTGQSLLETNYGLMTPVNLINCSTNETLNSVSSKRSFSPPLSPPTISSMSTTLISNPVIDIHSPENSYCPSDSDMNEDAPVDHKIIYQQLKNQVEELLGSTSHDDTRDTCTTNSVLSEIRRPISSSQTSFMSPNISVLDIPRIQCNPTETSSVDVTFDTQANMAEIITQRYLSPENSVAMTTHKSTVMDYSMNTHHYLSRHGLMDRENILDIKKLKSLPKLL